MKTVAVLFGGRSLEHDVSVVSGLQIVHALDPNVCTPIPIYVDHQNRWWIGEDLWRSEFYKGSGPDRDRMTEVMLSPGFGTSNLIPVALSAQLSALSPLPSALSPNARQHQALSPQPSALTPSTRGSVHVDVFIPVLHGTFGEDGSVQGLFELFGCAYVGCGVLASAIGMNKRLTKVIAQRGDVPVVPWLSCERAVLDRGSAWLKDLPAQVSSTLGFPAIVKPCNLGSSAGVTVAATPDELISGVLKVFEYDIEAIIEPFIKNRLEINVAVAGLDEPVPSISEMPITAQDSPLTFSEKYKRQGRKSIGSSEGMAGALRVLDPSDLPVEMRARARELATRVFSLLGCEGISRIDFLIDADKNELYFNEINTLPGSFAFYLWSAAPHFWTITELLQRLITRAERLAAMKRGLQRRPPAELRLLS